jgi:hypothetical protein
MSGDSPPTPSDDEVLEVLRAVAGRGLTQSRPANDDLIKYQYDIEGVEELLRECTLSEIHKHEPDHDYPNRNDYVVVLKIALDEEPQPFYVKVALHLPDMTNGRLLSFHYWNRL